MDVTKLRADLEAANTLLAEANTETIRLSGEISARDATVTDLQATVTDLQSKLTASTEALSSQAIEHGKEIAKLEGKLESSVERCTKLEGDAKTAGHRAADITRSHSFEGEMDSAPDGSQRAAGTGTQRPESLHERTANAFKAMADSFFNPKSA